MKMFDSIHLVTEEVKSILNNSGKKNVSLLYAFNATGKTRMSTILENEMEDEKVLCYNAFTEDMFTWDNEKFVFHIDSKSWLVKFINDQGLENDIIDNFREIVNSKVEPSFKLEDGEIIFNLATGDDSSENGIKISKGEESIFVWSIFYTILTMVIENLNIEEEDRTTSDFNNLEYVIIDDPVSSIDDSKIVAMALKLFEIINKSESKLKFLITTHHALFYNVLFNSFKRNTNNCNFKSLLLTQKDKQYELKEQRQDSPFAYHLMVKDEIQKAIDEDKLQKYHFNLFRSLIEKTSNFLGYNNWGDCIIGSDKTEFIRIINLYSHSRLSDLEYRELPNEDKKIFIDTYNDFIKEYKWGKNNG